MADSIPPYNEKETINMADYKNEESREVEFNERKIVSCRKDGHPCCFDECEENVEKPPKQSELIVTITADVGDAIKGFKSLQRELRETTKAARELESAYNDLNSAYFAKREDAQCSECGGSGIVSIGEGIKGVKIC